MAKSAIVNFTKEELKFIVSQSDTIREWHDLGRTTLNKSQLEKNSKVRKIALASVRQDESFALNIEFNDEARAAQLRIERRNNDE